MDFLGSLESGTCIYARKIWLQLPPRPKPSGAGEFFRHKVPERAKGTAFALFVAGSPFQSCGIAARLNPWCTQHRLSIEGCELGKRKSGRTPAYYSAKTPGKLILESDGKQRGLVPGPVLDARIIFPREPY